MGVNVTFRLHDGRQIQAADDRARSLMELARRAGVPGILGECGGDCSCATCHIYVDERWAQVVGASNPFEAELLETLDECAPNSRLACQVQLRPELDGLEVRVASRDI